MAEYGLLREAGAVAFTDGARAVGSARVMRLALSYARAFGALIVQHPEEPGLAAGGAATEGELATRLGLPGIPAAAEAMLVARDIALARITGGHVHFAHVSTAAALDLIRAAKAEGLHVTCDTAPPYFDLNETAIGDWRSYAKLSPRQLRCCCSCLVPLIATYSSNGRRARARTSRPDAARCTAKNAPTEPGPTTATSAIARHGRDSRVEWRRRGLRRPVGVVQA